MMIKNINEKYGKITYAVLKLILTEDIFQVFLVKKKKKN